MRPLAGAGLGTKTANHFHASGIGWAISKRVNAIFVGALHSNENRFVVEASANAAYATPGYLLFYRDNTLLAQRFDLKRFALTAETTTVQADVQFMPQVKRAVFAASDGSLLVAQSGSGVTLSQPIWFDRQGKELTAVGKPDVFGNVFLAPNSASIQPCCSRRCSAGYSAPWLTCSTSLETCRIRCAMAQPCIGSSAIVFRIKRSTVPCTRSVGLLTAALPLS